MFHHLIQVFGAVQNYALNPVAWLTNDWQR